MLHGLSYNCAHRGPCDVWVGFSIGIRMLIKTLIFSMDQLHGDSNILISSIFSIVEALPFGGVTNVTGSLPISLVLNLGLLGAAAYFTLIVMLKR